MPIAPAMAQADTCDNSVCCCRSSWAACSRSVTTGTPPNTICSICCFCRSSGWECGRATPAAGTTLTSLSYCGVLYLGGAIPADQFYAAMRHFWIGDTVGIITIIPAATSVFAFLSKARWRWSGYELVSCSVFILGMCLGFAVLFGVGAEQQPRDRKHQHEHLKNAEILGLDPNVCGCYDKPQLDA